MKLNVPSKYKKDIETFYLIKQIAYNDHYDNILKTNIH
jgi:hypothetical protein